MSRYAVENHQRKNQQEIAKNKSLWKSTKGNTMILTRQRFLKIVFWNQRPDGIVINKNHQTLHILKFKKSFDRNEDFLGVKEDEANEHCKSIIEALEADAPERTFEQINFVVGTLPGSRGAVVPNNLYKEEQDSGGACATHM